MVLSISIKKEVATEKEAQDLNQKITDVLKGDAKVSMSTVLIQELMKPSERPTTA